VMPRPVADSAAEGVWHVIVSMHKMTVVDLSTSAKLSHGTRL
jgi:hypothetical protein